MGVLAALLEGAVGGALRGQRRGILLQSERRDTDTDETLTLTEVLAEQLIGCYWTTDDNMLIQYDYCATA